YLLEAIRLDRQKFSQCCEKTVIPFSLLRRKHERRRNLPALLSPRMDGGTLAMSAGPDVPQQLVSTSQSHDLLSLAKKCKGFLRLLRHRYCSRISLGKRSGLECLVDGNYPALSSG